MVAYRFGWSAVIVKAQIDLLLMHFGA